MARKTEPRTQAAKPPARRRSGARGRAVDFAFMVAPLAIGALKKLMEDPDLAKKAQDQVDRLLKNSGDSPADMLETVKVLREQVDYLVGSADDDREAARAEAWSKQLEQCERAAKLVGAPGATRKERRALKKRIAALRSEILEAFIVEQQEDADAARSAEDPND
jgi:uncharacterized protein involved in exopolysaccharide biosynthesis